MKPQEYKIAEFSLPMGVAELGNLSYGGWLLVCIVPVVKREARYVGIGMPALEGIETTYLHYLRRDT